MNSPNRTRLGDAIRQLRKSKGLTLTVLAEAVGTKANVLSEFETGKKNPSLQMLEAIAEALDVSPGAFWGAELQGGGGTIRTYTLDTVYDGAVRGPLGLHGAEGAYAGLRKALKNSHLHRAGTPDHRVIELAGIPKGCVLVDLRIPLEVRVGGEVRLYLPAGSVLVADPEREPQAEDLVVAVYEPEPDPNGQELQQSESLSQLRRYELGPRGVPLLFELATDRAVTATTEGWRIVATIVDHRQAKTQS